MAQSWKNVLGALESPIKVLEFFHKQESENLVSHFAVGFSRRARVSSFQPLRREQIRPHHRSAVPQHNGFTQGPSADRVRQRESRHGKTVTSFCDIFVLRKMLSVMPSCVCLHKTMLFIHFTGAVQFSCCTFQPVECIIIIIITRCSAIAETPRCRVRYSFRQK